MPWKIQTKVINSRNLTPGCRSIQAWGLPYCRTLDYPATKDCRDYNIRKRILSGEYPKKRFQTGGNMPYRIKVWVPGKQDKKIYETKDEAAEAMYKYGRKHPEYLLQLELVPEEYKKAKKLR